MTKILIVEDDLVLNKSLSEYLSADGFEVISAIDGEAGLELAISEKPDLVLLDIILPKKDGYQVLKEIRANNEVKNVPIVLLTNLGSIADVEKALELGATTYLVKADYRMEEISLKIKGILNIE
ncbi:MAG: response regulator receiver modulated diguanylate cyclase/phosphodiesterase [uncultured bacterium]|nr:MAG: response regulator receiver modulated diguanylate cyclase/phosphodiesterase [uncultured bacterium]